jgi:hypothetical protein
MAALVYVQSDPSLLISLVPTVRVRTSAGVPKTLLRHFGSSAVSPRPQSVARNNDLSITECPVGVHFDGQDQ